MVRLGKKVDFGSGKSADGVKNNFFWQLKQQLMVENLTFQVLCVGVASFPAAAAANF